MPSILSAGLKLEGDIVSDGEVHVLGHHAGNIIARKVTIGEGGTVTGTIEAENVVINGTLSGRVSAHAVVLGRAAAVTADIVYVQMRVEPGASYEGYSRRVETIDTFAADQIQLSPPLRQQIERLRAPHGEVAGTAD
ncbi:MAG: polymer-forming cytoskeletal protein [Alphaproteobacteria bacterium]|nr:polymer-forming cytoskeletal protein [Alphaproteobacteria bacterium]